MILNSLSPLDHNPLAYITNEDLSSLSYARGSDLLTIPQVRHHIALKRWNIFRQSGANLQTHKDMNVGVLEGTIDHNIIGIQNSLDSLPMLERSELMFRPVMAIDRVYSYRERSVFPGLSCLLVGSRTEYEVLLAMSYGLDPANIRALDLLSYSPWIQVGDMHKLPYPDNSFDIMLFGWVTAYSNDMERIASEIVRVAKPKAVVSIGNDCYTVEHLMQDRFANAKRPQDSKTLLSYFNSNLGEIFYSHNPNYPRSDVKGFTGHLIVTFEISK